MDGTIEEVCIPWKKARRSLDLAVFVQDDGYNGTVAWRDGMMGLQDLEGEEANQIKQAVELNPFVKMAERESKAEKLDDETINDVECYVIQMTTKDKPAIKFCIDKKTDQIIRSSLTQNNPQFGEIEVVAEPSDYAEFGPVKLPTKTKVKFGEVFEFETTFTDTKVNADVDETVFDKPKDEPADAPKDESKARPRKSRSKGGQVAVALIRAKAFFDARGAIGRGKSPGSISRQMHRFRSAKRCICIRVFRFCRVHRAT